MITQQTEAIEIEVGHHVVWNIFGVGWHVDTILATIVAGLIIVALGVWMRRTLSVRKPKGIQLFFETLTKQVEDEVEGTMGLRTAPFVVPVAMTLFLFILIANWLSILPLEDYIPPPASDVNLAYAMGLLVIVWMHVTGVRKRGFKGYYHHLVQPYAFMLPLNIIEEIVKPFTLALRLFGNIFAGVIMVSLIALFPAYLLWAPEVAWKLFDMFIGLIQAFIFALLTIIYFSSVRPDEEGAH